jgi:hypothetical protein
MTMKQFQATVTMIRGVCEGKFKMLSAGRCHDKFEFFSYQLRPIAHLIISEQIDGLKVGEFLDNKDLKVNYVSLKS